jgi:ATP-dependent DNA ligase
MLCAPANRVSSRRGRACSQRAAGLDYDETGRPQFYDLLRGKRPPAYVAFDVVWLNGVDLRPVPLSERRELLRVILPKGPGIVSEALSVGGRGWELFELMCANDLEGIVASA